MARPVKILTECETKAITAAWATANGNISHVADQLHVGWQTANRWLVQIGLVEPNQQMDRPGTRWGRFRVVIDGVNEGVVEAPSWAVAMEMVAMAKFIIDWDSARVVETQACVTSGNDRQSVRAKLSNLMNEDAVRILERHYRGLSVAVEVEHV